MATYGVATSSSNYRGRPGYGLTAHPYRVNAVVALSAYVSADVLQVIPLPAKTAVIAAGIELVTSAAGGASLALGTGAAAAKWVSAGLTSATVGLMALAPQPSTTAAMLITNALDTIDVTINTSAPGAAVINVWAVLQDVSNNLGSSTTTQVVTLSSATTV